jgi:hypothetical protein
VNQWGYVLLGWLLTVAVVVTYAAVIIVRGRALSRRLPPEDRRWM